jgi:hypothetical protein
MIHVEFINDDLGDTVDVKYYCSGFCYTEDTGKSSEGHTHPGGSETDYNVYCASCDVLLWHGIDTLRRSYD